MSRWNSEEHPHKIGKQDPEYDTDPNGSEAWGERQLVAAVIARALLDATNPTKFNGDDHPSTISSSAKEWILSNEDEPFSFLWCAQILCQEAGWSFAVRAREAVSKGRLSKELFASGRARLRSTPRTKKAYRQRNFS